MIAGGCVTIVNIGGVSAQIGASKRAHVAAAKAGLVGLTKALAVEFADRNVTVNCVAPGKIGGERSASAGVSPKMPAEILLGREGEIEERSEEHTSELQSLMRISYAVFCLKKKHTQT